MSIHRCANCRRALTATHALTAGKLCDKCDWAGSAAEFREDAPTKPRLIAKLAADMMAAGG